MKKKEQLGLNPSTAAHTLRKSLIWNFLERLGETKCFRCQEEMSLSSFSVDHKIDWLDSTDPLFYFFDISNIAFSHQRCNYKAGRKRVSSLPDEERKALKKKNNRELKRRQYSKEKRREKYLLTGT